MRKLTEFVKWFIYITTCILIVFAANVSIAGDETIPAGTLWQILMSGFVTAGVTVFLRPSGRGNVWGDVIRIIVHYIILCVIMIGYGCFFGWMHFRVRSIIMMMISVAAVYFLVCLSGYWIDRKQADEINRKLRGKYSEKE